MSNVPQDLFELAKQARERSYSPYSHCKVGAAFRTTDGRVFEGCNVENSSYGNTICAERSAIVHAVSKSGAFRIAEIVVVTDASPPWAPCGMCRQAIAEFGRDAQVHLANLQGESRSTNMREIFPDAFTPDQLNK